MRCMYCIVGKSGSAEPAGADAKAQAEVEADAKQTPAYCKIVCTCISQCHDARGDATPTLLSQHLVLLFSAARCMCT